jgi:PEP-CTERM motif
MDCGQVRIRRSDPGSSFKRGAGVRHKSKLLFSVAAVAAATQAIASANAESISSFTEGDVVVVVEGNGSGTGSYTDNQAAPLTLYEYDPSGASFEGSFELPQSASGANFPVSGEYGSSSEGTLQLSGNGRYLTVMGYGVNANTFNANPGSFSPDSSNTALGQSGSLTGQSYTPVSRVVALIGANGSVNSSTALFNIFDANNPRSVYTADGSSFYVSGQGTKGDATGGVFYATLGSHSATSITGPDAGSGSSQDTREVQVFDNQLYVSTDSKSGSTNRSFIGTLGAKGALPTSEANGGDGPAMLPGFGNSGGTGKIKVTAANANNVNAGLVGQDMTVNLSPENYFFANADTLYVADTGAPKNTSADSPLGDGGLQKWTLSGGTWTLDYTISAGLDLVANNTADPSNTSGTTGLYGLAGKVVTIGGTPEVELFATNYTIGDTDQTYLYGITDVLGDLTAQAGEKFVELEKAPEDANFKGVAFAPAAPEPSTWAMMMVGFVGLGFVARRRLQSRTSLAT